MLNVDANEFEQIFNNTEQRITNKIPKHKIT